MPIKRPTPKKTEEPEDKAPLTPERHAVLDAIRAYRRDNDGRLPAFTDISQALGISRWTARGHCVRLRRGKYITYRDGEHRSLMVTRKGQRVPDLNLRAAKKSKKAAK